LLLESGARALPREVRSSGSQRGASIKFFETGSLGRKLQD
jgi:hypothetical protein